MTTNSSFQRVEGRWAVVNGLSFVGDDSFATQQIVLTVRISDGEEGGSKHYCFHRVLADDRQEFCASFL